VSTETTGHDARTEARMEARIEAAITAQRMERVEACTWATPAVRDVLAEYAADLRDAIPLSVGLDRIRRAIEADRAARAEGPESERSVRLVS
jgi:hypothetical protein